MAYTRDIDVVCRYCGGPARLEVFTEHGLSVGTYCRLDAKHEVDRLRDQERKRKHAPPVESPRPRTDGELADAIDEARLEIIGLRKEVDHLEELLRERGEE